MTPIEIMWLVLKVAILALILLNLYVSVRLIFYRGYSKFQKSCQLLIVWLLPIVGALLVRSLIVVPRWVETDHGFTADGGESPPGIGLGH